ncbi:unnamed protein product [Boreogadus saida]
MKRCPDADKDRAARHGHRDGAMTREIREFASRMRGDRTEKTKTEEPGEQKMQRIVVETCPRLRPEMTPSEGVVSTTDVPTEERRG